MKKLSVILIAFVVSACVENQACNTSLDNTSAMKRDSEVVRVCADAALILSYNGRYWRYVSGYPMFYSKDVTIEKTCRGDNI